jgi:hypothetical protein
MLISKACGKRPLSSEIGGTPMMAPYVRDGAVHFEVVDGKAAISRKALKDHFGAGPTLQSWIDAYLAHRALIDAKAAAGLKLSGGEPGGEPVMLTSAMFESD